jgi:hypothetical protein
VRQLTFVVAIAAVACAAAAPPSSLPVWLQTKIVQLEQFPVGQAPREIVRTTYSGRTVYFVPPRCCDIPSELYEESGALICYPNGGFAGGDGRCPSFSLPPNSVTVWRDARPPSSSLTPASGGK